MVDALRERELPEAERIVRLAFGTLSPWRLRDRRLAVT
ncbi:hypothetical protein AKJ09_05370 [Labilithrix luteola]|uniref:Uncharacterized protein n=1 Tax=Labilithrix luteola TaxID=1391654 RepID=A0A0K1PZA5_9BACT|nr:hypothetical protein AKJ09_05370 [Labilithrix luteola]